MKNTIFPFLPMQYLPNRSAIFHPQFLIPALLLMSLWSLLFGCNAPQSPAKAVEWPRFPETDNPATQVSAIPLADSFRVVSMYITPDRQHLYVLGSQAPQKGRPHKNTRNRPGDLPFMDYRLTCMNAEGEVQYQQDISGIDWLYGGTFGLAAGSLMLYMGTHFWVLDLKTLVVQERIPVCSPEYIPWVQTTMTRDEYEADYKEKFEAVLKNPTACKWLYWWPARAYFVFVEAPKDKRAMWSPLSYDKEHLDDLQQRLEPLSLSLADGVQQSDTTTHFSIMEDSASVREIEYLSGGTQLRYPDYKSRSILQYELVVNGKKTRFSTTDRDAHDLHLHFSDNGRLSMADGSVWIICENVLYRIH
jgi:hypothetical protein